MDRISEFATLLDTLPDDELFTLWANAHSEASPTFDNLELYVIDVWVGERTLVAMLSDTCEIIAEAL